MSEDIRAFYRIRLPEELTRGHIRFGRKSIDVIVDERSVAGYSIRLKETDLARLQLKKGAWVLEHDGELSKVHAEWFLDRCDGTVQMGLRRLDDVTPMPQSDLGANRPAPLRMFGAALSKNIEITLGAIVVAMIWIMTAPGLGDRIGTAGPIRSGTESVMKSVDRVLQQVFP